MVVVSIPRSAMGDDLSLCTKLPLILIGVITTAIKSGDWESSCR